MQELEALLEELDRQPRSERKGDDALDVIIHAPPRTTAVTPLRDHEAVRRFRAELRAGLIRADTINQLLVLIRTAIQVYMR